MTNLNEVTDLTWKENWETARRNHEAWWRGDGLVLWVTAPREAPVEDVPEPDPPRDLYERWFDAGFRLRREVYRLSRTYFGGDAFPLFSCISAAGDLAAYLGCEVNLSPRTVWCDPCIGEPPEASGPVRLNRVSRAFRDHLAMVRLAARESRGRWLVVMPDLVENVDILSAMRGPQTLMFDLVDRPDWVVEKVAEINRAYFEAFDAFADEVRDAHGGNAFIFNVWGPGRTAKVQCDACAMFGPRMFRRCVVPALTEQCRWLDFAMYHLDGEDCLPNLDELLAIEPLQAIEWTPRRLSVGDSGGHPDHWPLYRRILDAGKAVQAIAVEYDEVIPLLDACGGKGMFISTSAPTESAARELAVKADAYR